MGAEIILEHGLAELYALFNAFFMRHVDAVMCATDAAADALLVCVCVYQFTASLHTVQENQNGNHENQHPAAVAAAAQAAASGKCKVNFVEGHASSRTEQ